MHDDEDDDILRSMNTVQLDAVRYLVLLQAKVDEINIRTSSQTRYRWVESDYLHSKRVDM